jgi:hypothetical protein
LLLTHLYHPTSGTANIVPVRRILLRLPIRRRNDLKQSNSPRQPTHRRLLRSRPVSFPRKLIHGGKLFHCSRYFHNQQFCCRKFFHRGSVVFDGGGNVYHCCGEQFYGGGFVCTACECECDSSRYYFCCDVYFWGDCCDQGGTGGGVDRAWSTLFLVGNWMYEVIVQERIGSG